VSLRWFILGKSTRHKGSRGVESLWKGGPTISWSGLDGFFQVEAAALLNSRDKLKDWDDRCELLLEDAFAGVAPRDDFRTEDSTKGRTS
jgi:hypothetical protein